MKSKIIVIQKIWEKFIKHNYMKKLIRIIVMTLICIDLSDEEANEINNLLKL